MLKNKPLAISFVCFLFWRVILLLFQYKKPGTFEAPAKSTEAPLPVIDGNALPE
jgi:hypothetical protein